MQKKKKKYTGNLKFNFPNFAKIARLKTGREAKVKSFRGRSNMLKGSLSSLSRILLMFRCKILDYADATLVSPSLTGHLFTMPRRNPLPFFPLVLSPQTKRARSHIYVRASVQKNNKDTLAIMKTSRRRASAIITGSQPSKGLNVKRYTRLDITLRGSFYARNLSRCSFHSLHFPPGGSRRKPSFKDDFHRFRSDFKCSLTYIEINKIWASDAKRQLGMGSSSIRKNPSRIQ